VAPTIARLPLSELAVRRRAVRALRRAGEVGSLDEALAETNKVEFGLTAGSFPSGGRGRALFDEVEAGVCYANKRTGATTGAWPGAQAFCG